jgi:excisionase family DNA binding protein
MAALLTTDEVAAILKVNRRTVVRWTADGRLHRVELGARTVRYRAEDVAALIDPTNSDAPVNQTEATPSSGRQPRHVPV